MPQLQEVGPVSLEVYGIVLETSTHTSPVTYLAIWAHDSFAVAGVFATLEAAVTGWDAVAGAVLPLITAEVSPPHVAGVLEFQADSF